MLFSETTGDGPALMMVAGMGDDHSLWDPLVARLRDRFTCIAYDHRGTGASPPLPEGSEIADLAEDGHRLLEELGLTGVVGIGCSMGGTVLQEWVLRYPDDFSKLVLISTLARPHRLLRGMLDHWEALYETGDHDLLIEHLSLLCLAPAAWDDRPDLVEEVLAEGELAPGYIVQLRAAKRFDVLERLGEIRQPTLVLGAREDMLVSVAHSEELAERLPDARLLVLPTGHVPFWEAPEETAAAIRSFCE